MSAAHIIVRDTARSGRRYLVRYRLGGRGHRLRHAGSFHTKRDAQTRRDMVAGELAAGRDPKTALEQLAEGTAAPGRTLSQWTQQYLDSRHDWAQSTAASARFCLNRVNETLGHRDPHTVTPADIQQLVGELSANLKPATVRRYLDMLRPLLDFTGVEPNPARDRTVKLPAAVRAPIEPPTGREFLAILDAAPARWRLPLVVLEQTGIRIGELASLTWGNVDTTHRRIRITGQNAKTRQTRWVDVPEWLLQEIEQTCPPGDRAPDRKVFPGLSKAALWRAMRDACQQAGIPHYHPHDLRHRRLSLWHGQGVPAAELAQRAGHSRPSITLDTYSHVMPPEETLPDALKDALKRALSAAPGDAPVMPKTRRHPITTGKTRNRTFVTLLVRCLAPGHVRPAPARPAQGRSAAAPGLDRRTRSVASPAGPPSFAQDVLHARAGSGKLPA